FLARALEKRRQERFQTAAEMIAALDGAAAAQAAFAAPAEPAALPPVAEEAAAEQAPVERTPKTLPLVLGELSAAGHASSPVAAGGREPRRRVLSALGLAAAGGVALFLLARGDGTPATLARPVPVLPLVGPAQKLLSDGNPAGALALLEPAVGGPL